MNKRERLEKTIAGEKADRIPVALWRHWPGDDQRAGDLAKATVNFQKRWDWDFVKVSPADSYPLNDYGTADVWEGTVEGVRRYVKRAVHTPQDWETLPMLDPTKGWLGMHLETLRLVRAGVGDDVPVIHTIFSPFAQAKNLAGTDVMLRHMHQHPDSFKKGLQIIAENTMRYLDAMKDTGVDGIYYALQHASYDDMTPETYAEFGKPLDLQILDSRPDHWWFTLAHIHGDAPMFDLITDYPVQMLNWHDRETTPNLKIGKQKFTRGAVCGGLGAWDEAHNGTPESVRTQAQDAIAQTDGERFILATGCVMMTTTPQANIRAVREVVG